MAAPETDLPVQEDDFESLAKVASYIKRLAKGEAFDAKKAQEILPSLNNVLDDYLPAGKTVSIVAAGLAFGISGYVLYRAIKPAASATIDAAKAKLVGGPSAPVVSESPSLNK